MEMTYDYIDRLKKSVYEEQTKDVQEALTALRRIGEYTRELETVENERQEEAYNQSVSSCYYSTM